MKEACPRPAQNLNKFIRDEGECFRRDLGHTEVKSLWSEGNKLLLPSLYWWGHQCWMHLGAWSLHLKDEVPSVHEAQTASNFWWWRSKLLAWFSNSDINPRARALRLSLDLLYYFPVCDSRRALLFLFNSTSLWFFFSLSASSSEISDKSGISNSCSWKPVFCRRVIMLCIWFTLNRRCTLKSETTGLGILVTTSQLQVIKWLW